MPCVGSAGKEMGDDRAAGIIFGSESLNGFVKVRVKRRGRVGITL